MSRSALKASLRLWRRRLAYRERRLRVSERHHRPNSVAKWRKHAERAQLMVKRRERQLRVNKPMREKAASIMVNWAHEPVREQGGNNRGPRVDGIIKLAGGTPGEPWCFGAGTLIATPRGLVRIEDLRDGDEVIAGSGTPRVAMVRTDRGEADTVRLRALGVADTIASDDHPYLARRNTGRPGRPVLGEPEWVPAGSLRRGDYIQLPALVGGDVQFSPASAYVFGRWLADGWSVIKPQRVIQKHRAAFVCCSHGEADSLRDKLVEADLLRAEREYKTVTQFALPVRALPFWEAGGNARDKRLPGECLRWNNAAREALLQGYLDGDGHEYEPQQFAANTVSRELAYGVAMLARSVGRHAAVYAYSRDTTATIEGRKVNQAPVRYEVKVRTCIPQVKDGDWHPVRAVESAGRRPVYNLTVAEEATFIADGALVHNCGDAVAAAYILAGSKSVTRAWAYVPTLEKVLTRVLSPKRGHVVIFNFDGGVPDHTGLFLWDNRDGSYLCVEGNTRPGSSASDAGGGEGVYLRTRPKSQVQSVRRVLR